MNKILVVFIFSIVCNAQVFSQTSRVINSQVTAFKIQDKANSIEFVVLDTLLNEKKPIFLWCQGSLPIPLFIDFGTEGYYFSGGGVSNFNHSEISEKYHLVIVSMPATPLVANQQELNANFQYIDTTKSDLSFSDEFVKSDYLDNYVSRASSVLKFLQKQKWVDQSELIVAGHSQGCRVAAKLGATNKKITTIGLFSPNPFGRIDQLIRQARVDAEHGKISWRTADSLMNEYYKMYKTSADQNATTNNFSLRSWNSFSETFYDDWLDLKARLYLAYGTEDISSALCDIVPIFFIEDQNENLHLKRYIGLEHNFFPINNQGQINYDNPHWPIVMDEFIEWLEE